MTGVTPAVVTFDVGQTLVELDLDFLVERLAGRALVVEAGSLARALPAAWAHHDQLVHAGASHPWHAFMSALLVGAGADPAAVEPAVAWLWSEQPHRNLWRKPIAGMRELACELRARGVRVGVVSNSEGRIAELLDEVGFAGVFHAVVDSGRFGIAKPDPRIFAHALAQLEVPAPRVAIHVGDSWAADIVGARAAGWQTVWFGPAVDVHDAAEARVAIDALLRA